MADHLRIETPSPLDRVVGLFLDEGVDRKTAEQQARYAVEGLAALCGLLEHDDAPPTQNDRSAA